MSIRLEYQGNITKWFGRFENPDFSYLMRRIEALMREDHTRAIMGGIDKDGVPFRPTSYRRSSTSPVTKRNRYNRGAGPSLQDENGNLTTAQYRRLTGPPLAPRGMNSRIIANYRTSSGKSGNTWFAESALIDIVSRKGEPFMQYHFDGVGQWKRDDRGIRPWGMAEIQKAVGQEVKKLLDAQAWEAAQ